MSDISGGQSTEQTKVELIVDGKPSKGFLDIVKTLQDLGAYVESSVELLGRFEEKINNIGTAADNINKKTKKYSATSVSQVGKKKKAVTVLNDVPTDASTPAGKEGINILRSQKQLIDSQKELTRALEDSVKASITTNQIKANAMALNANTKALGEPSRIRTRNSWSDLMDETRDFRNAKNYFEAGLYRFGYKDREYEQKETLRRQQIERGIYFSDRRNYDGFTFKEIFKNFLRQQTGRVINSNSLGGVVGRIGSFINPGETLQKKTASGVLLKGTGVAMGGAIGALAVEGLTQVVNVLERLAQTSLTAYGSISKLETSLGVVYGSRTQAESVFDEIANYAIKSPFGVEQLTEMATLLKQSGIYESDLMDTLKTIGDLAGGNEEKYRRIANNYAQVLAIGKATTKDMREFANAGIPIFDATANYLGVSRKNLSSEIEAGNVTAQVLEGVFKQLTSEGGLFYKATEKNAETYNARKTNLADIKQLSLANVGEALYTGAVFGDYGKSSLAKTFLDLEESFFKFFGDKAENITQKEAYKAVQENSRNLNNLTEIISDYTSYLNSPEGVQDVYKSHDVKLQLKEALLALEAEKTLFSEDERLNILAKQYDSIMENTGGQTAYDVQEMNLRLRELQSELGKAQTAFNYASIYGTEEEYLNAQYEVDRLTAEIIELNARLEPINNELSKLTSDVIYANAIRSAETTSRQMADEVNKNQAYNKNSMTNYNSYIEEKYLQTDAYKKELEKQEKELLQKAKDAATLKNSLGIKDDSLNFLRTNKLATGFNMSREVFSDALEQFFTAEDLSLSEENIASSIDQIKKNIENLLYVELEQYEKDFYNKILDSLKNTEGREKDANVMRQFSDILSNAKNDGDLQQVLGWMLINYKQLDISEHIEEVEAQFQKEKDAAKSEFAPLWAKIAGDIFDVPASKLEWTGFQDKDKEHYNHGYGLETYRTGIYDNPKFKEDKDFRGSVMSRNGVEALLRATGTDYLKELVFARNAFGEEIRNANGVKQYDWDKSFESLKDIALSMKSTTEMSNALANYYKSEREKFTSYATEGIIAKEDWANLLNPEYTAEMGFAGEHFDQLQNALSAEYTVLEDGTIKLTHAGMQIALEMEKMLEPMEVLTGQFDKLKQSVAGVIASTEQTNLKSYAIRNQLFGQGLSVDQQTSLADVAYSVISEELNKLGLDENQRNAYLQQSTDFIARAVSGNTEGLNSTEIALVEAIQKMIEATQDNTSALINFELTKKLEELRNGEGGLSFDWKSLKFGQIDSFGNSMKQQRILESMGISGYSYDQVSSAIQSNPDLKDSFSQSLSDATGLDTMNMTLDEILDKWSLMIDSEKQFNESLDAVANGSLQSLGQFATSGIVSTFQEIGKSLVTSEDASEGIGQAWKDLGANLANQISTLLITEGLRIMGSAAMAHDWGRFGIGMAMVAAGGLGSIVSGAMSASEESDNADEEIQRLQNIKDMLADLLAQARIDAEYYEKNLRHQYAISANEELTRQSVNDAIITPKGDIISTHPDDWLIATKTPHDLVGGSAPVVTITIVNESGNTVQVAKTEQSRNGNNIDVKAVIIATVNEALADGDLDGGLEALQYRQNGRTVYY